MIFNLSAQKLSITKTFYIGLDSEIMEYNAKYQTAIKSSGNFTKYDKTFQRITKEYKNLNGNIIIYGVRSRYMTLNFVIECLQKDYKYIMEVLNFAFEYNVVENFPNEPIRMKLSGDLKETKICNHYSNGQALYTISGTLVEV